MLALEKLLPLINEDGGIILRVGLSRKPLWFSDCRFASTFSSQYPGAAMTVGDEGRAASDRFTRPDTLPGKSAAVTAGLGYTDEEALIKAIGEGVERFCAQIITPENHRIVFGTYDELKRKYRMLPVEKWRTLTDDQVASFQSMKGIRKPLTTMREDAPVRWLVVHEMPSGEPWLVPIISGYLGIRTLSPAEVVLEQISTGLACHRTLDEAIIAGLCEVIERDAIMGMWLKRLSPPRVSHASIASVSALAGKMLAELSRTEFKLVITDITNDIGIPAYFATLVYGKVPYSIVGAGCHPSTAVALEKAIGEVMMALAGYAESQASESSGLYYELQEGQLPPDSDLASMHDHSEVYVKNDLRSRLDFILAAPERDLSPVRSEPIDPQKALGELIDKVQSRGFRVFVNDLTIPEVSRVGLSVVKVIVPGLVPLYCYERNKPLGCTRLETYESIFPRLVSFPEERNPWPHPFP